MKKGTNAKKKYTQKAYAIGGVLTQDTVFLIPLL